MNGVTQSPIFLVGCPRSGTTLLQSLLAAHPLVTSFPESKFFEYLIPADRQLAKQLGLVSRRFRPRMGVFFEEIERPELINELSNSPFARAYPKKFAQILDRLTAEQGKQHWVEKTPGHIFYLDDIERYLKQAKFIHLCRAGEDVVASLYDVTHKYPKAWGGRPWGSERCVDLWAQAIDVSRRKQGQANHWILTYENLVADPEMQLQHVCQFIGVEYTPAMVENYSQSAQKWAMSRVGRNVETVIQSPKKRKFHKLFDLAQQQKILEDIAAKGIDLGAIASNSNDRLTPS